MSGRSRAATVGRWALVVAVLVLLVVPGRLLAAEHDRDDALVPYAGQRAGGRVASGQTWHVDAGVVSVGTDPDAGRRGPAADHGRHGGGGHHRPPLPSRHRALGRPEHRPDRRPVPQRLRRADPGPGAPRTGDRAARRLGHPAQGRPGADRGLRRDLRRRRAPRHRARRPRSACCGAVSGGRSPAPRGAPGPAAPASRPGGRRRPRDAGDARHDDREAPAARAEVAPVAESSRATQASGRRRAAGRPAGTGPGAAWSAARRRRTRSPAKCSGRWRRAPRPRPAAATTRPARAARRPSADLARAAGAAPGIQLDRAVAQPGDHAVEQPLAQPSRRHVGAVARQVAACTAPSAPAGRRPALPGRSDPSVPPRSAHQLGLDREPDRLGVDEQPVHVEQDRPPGSAPLTWR